MCLAYDFCKKQSGTGNNDKQGQQFRRNSQQGVDVAVVAGHADHVIDHDAVDTVEVNVFYFVDLGVAVDHTQIVRSIHMRAFCGQGGSNLVLSVVKSCQVVLIAHDDC